jgi:F0F1-type ATP synthase assembly protein I
MKELILISLIILASCSTSRNQKKEYQRLKDRPVYATKVVDTIQDSKGKIHLSTRYVCPPCDCDKSIVQILAENRTERVKARQDGRTDRQESVDGRKMHNSDNRNETKQIKSDNKREEALAKENRKLQQTIAKFDKRRAVAESRHKKQLEKAEKSFWKWFWVVLVIGIVIGVFISTFLKRIFKSIRFFANFVSLAVLHMYMNSH